MQEEEKNIPVPAAPHILVTLSNEIARLGKEWNVEKQRLHSLHLQAQKVEHQERTALAKNAQKYKENQEERDALLAKKRELLACSLQEIQQDQTDLKREHEETVHRAAAALTELERSGQREQEEHALEDLHKEIAALRRIKEQKEREIRKLIKRIQKLEERITAKKNDIDALQKKHAAALPLPTVVPISEEVQEKNLLLQHTEALKVLQKRFGDLKKKGGNDPALDADMRHLWEKIEPHKNIEEELEKKKKEEEEKIKAEAEAAIFASQKKAKEVAKKPKKPRKSKAEEESAYQCKKYSLLGYAFLLLGVGHFFTREWMRGKSVQELYGWDVHKSQSDISTPSSLQNEADFNVVDARIADYSASYGADFFTQNRNAVEKENAQTVDKKWRVF